MQRLAPSAVLALAVVWLEPMSTVVEALHCFLIVAEHPISCTDSIFAYFIGRQGVNQEENRFSMGLCKEMFTQTGHESCHQVKACSARPPTVPKEKQPASFSNTRSRRRGDQHHAHIFIPAMMRIRFFQWKELWGRKVETVKEESPFILSQMPESTIC